MYKKLMDAIIAEAKLQNVWFEPHDTDSAVALLERIDTSNVIPILSPKGRRRRIDELSWLTLAKGCYD